MDVSNDSDAPQIEIFSEKNVVIKYLRPIIIGIIGLNLAVILFYFFGNIDSVVMSYITLLTLYMLIDLTVIGFRRSTTNEDQTFDKNSLRELNLGKVLKQNKELAIGFPILLTILMLLFGYIEKTSFLEAFRIAMTFTVSSLVIFRSISLGFAIQGYSDFSKTSSIPLIVMLAILTMISFHVAPHINV